jgi:ABC-2 type transport system permease protein
MEDGQGDEKDLQEAGLMQTLSGSIRKTGVIFEFEVRKLIHDPVEVFVRVIQPILWLVIFGSVFTRTKLIPTGNVSYQAYITPGIMAQSVLFTSIFFGIAITWDRDAGILAKLMVTPTSRAAIVLGKASSAGVRGILQAFVIILVALALGVTFSVGPLSIVGIVLVIFLMSTCFASLSIFLASFMKNRERFMGVVQLITMPLFFASNALYPIEIMPVPLQYVARVNPLYYVVDSLRGLLLTGDLSRLPMDLAVLLVITAIFTAGGTWGLKRLIT